MAKQISEETRQTLARRQAALTALTKHPSWDELKDEVGRKRGQIEKQILARMIPQMRPTTPINEPELFFLRGFIAGMEWFAAVPELAEESLTRFLTARGINTEETKA